MQAIEKVNLIQKLDRIGDLWSPKIVGELRERNISLEPGEFVIIPHGVEHCPLAAEEVHVMLLEPKTTLNTGTTHNERSAEAEWI